MHLNFTIKSSFRMKSFIQRDEATFENNSEMEVSVTQKQFSS